MSSWVERRCRNALMVEFYERVSADELLRPLFGDMPADHPRHVADFGRGAGRIASLHREPRRWVNLLLDSADEIGLPGDPEFRSALVAYLEWGSRLAVMNSKLPAETVADPATLMPHWSWGVPSGPYEPEQE